MDEAVSLLFIFQTIGIILGFTAIAIILIKLKQKNMEKEDK
jgi:hypothetical protein